MESRAANDIVIAMGESVPVIVTAAGGFLLVTLTFGGVYLFPNHASLAGGVAAVIGGAINMAIQFVLLPRLSQAAVKRQESDMRKIYWPAGH